MAQDRQPDRVVFHRQDRWHGFRMGGNSRIFGGPAQGEAYRERGACACRAFDTDLAVHQGGQLARKRQAKSQARVSARETALRLPERIKNSVEFVWGNADAGVFHLSDNPLRSSRPTVK